MGKKYNTIEFIQKARLIHGDKYNYDKVDYKNGKHKVKIDCFLHGEFEQRPSNHLLGIGCKKCGDILTGNSQKLTQDEFIKRATKIHWNKYDYSLVEYTLSTKKVKINCLSHGEFLQEANSHLQGIGCPICANIDTSKIRSESPTGWSLTNWINSAKKSKKFDSFKVYIIKCWDENERFYKIGRTFREIVDRFKSSMPYNYEILQIYIGTAEEIYNLEKILKKQNKEYKYIPKIEFNGMYECFKNVENYDTRTKN